MGNDRNGRGRAMPLAKRIGALEIIWHNRLKRGYAQPTGEVAEDIDAEGSKIINAYCD